MRKSFLLFAALLSFSFSLKAQVVKLKSFVPVPVKATTGHVPPNGAFDTLNLYSANNWQAFYYEYRGGGTVFGTNNLTSANAHIMEDANYFDVSASGYNYLQGGLVYFTYANSDVQANLDSDILFKVYDDTGGVPGTLLDSTSLTLRLVHQDVVQGKLTEFTFSSPVQLPASKTFYISIDHSKFKWNISNHDSIAIVATADGATANHAFQYTRVAQDGKQWYPVNEFWTNKTDSLDVNLFIFPLVSSSQGGCLTLPVSIFNFGGSIKNSQAYLNWSTATESNNKGFYVERSKDGRDFSTTGFVNGAGNSTTIKNYSYVDIALKDMNVSTTYYRLKQVDVDGKYSYSSVLPLNLENIVQWRLYPNPVKNTATVELHLDAASKVTAQVIAHDGRILLNIDKGLLTEGIQQFSINTQHLAKGSYIVRITAGDKKYSQAIIKE